MDENFLNNVKDFMKNLYNKLKNFMTYLYNKIKPYILLWYSKEFTKSYFIYLNTKNIRIRNKHLKRLKILYSDNGL